MPTLEDFKLFLITHDISLDPAYKLVSLCPKLLKDYTFDQIIMTVPFLIIDLKPVNKTIIISPIIYNAITLDAMKNNSGIMAHISSTLAKKGDTIIQRELYQQFKRAYTKIEQV